MKRLIILTTVFSFLPLMAFAQHSVTVEQKGNGNSVTITQNGSVTKTGDCLESLASLKNKNVMVVKNPGEGDTLFTAKGKQFYLLSKVLNSSTKFKALQKGLENGLYVLLPDAQSALSYLESKQQGHRNKAIVQINKASADVDISQNGTGNTFILNPCSGEDKK